MERRKGSHLERKWTVDRPTIQIDPLPPPPMPFEGIRVQRERESPGPTSKPSEPLQDARVAMRSDLESEPKPTLTPGEERLKMTPEQKREEALSAAGELAREPKDAPVPPDSDSEKRRAMKAATVDASSSGLQMERLADGRQPDGCRGADAARFDGRRVKDGR